MPIAVGRGAGEAENSAEAILLKKFISLQRRASIRSDNPDRDERHPWRPSHSRA